MNVSPDNAAAAQSLTPERLAAARGHSDDVMKFDFAKAYLWMLVFSAVLSVITCSYTLIKQTPSSQDPVSASARDTASPASVVSLQASVQGYQRKKLEAQQLRVQKAKIGLPLAILNLLAALAMLKTFSPARAPAYTIICMILVLSSLSVFYIIIMAIFLIPTLRSSLRHKKFLESKDSPALTLPS